MTWNTTMATNIDNKPPRIIKVFKTKLDIVDAWNWVNYGPGVMG